MTITSIKGTDLTKVKGLTQTQLNEACGDAETTSARRPHRSHPVTKRFG